VELKIVNHEGEKAGEVKVSDDIFAVPMNQHVVHSALTWYLASRRRGTHSAKTRAEVSGGGVKPWKQKGTGRARAGSTRSPLWRKGGVIFPPKPRDYSYSLPKKVRKLALKVVLSERAKNERIIILDEMKVSSGKTKEMISFLKKIGVDGTSMIIFDKSNTSVQRSARNIEGVELSSPAEVNIHGLLASKWLVMTKESAKQLEEALK
jgi:large subunit ribosomal protein L4